MRSILIPVASLLLALPAVAEEHQKPNGDARHEAPGYLLERLIQLEAYADGTSKEVDEKFTAAMEKLKERNPEEFKKFDTDGDGKVSRDEARAAIERFTALLKEKAPELFAKIDTNGDGKLSADELKAAREKLREDHHKGGDDTNKGGDQNPPPPGQNTGGDKDDRPERHQ
jgi:hypothetical protein